MLAKPFSAFPLQITNINFETYIVKTLDSQPESCSKRDKAKKLVFIVTSLCTVHTIFIKYHR